MPPKGGKGGKGKGLEIIGGGGATRQQREEAEEKKLKEMAEQLFAESHAPKQAKAAKNKKAVSQRQKVDETLAQRRAAAEAEFERAHHKLYSVSAYVNEYIPLEEGASWMHVGKDKWIRYEQFKPEYLTAVVDLLTVSLSEPYNPFTYKHFLSGWPDLAICVFGVASEKEPKADEKGELIATVVSKVERKQPVKPLRGYIAMLAVAEKFRGHRLGQRLVKLTVDLMKKKKVEEVCLETPTSNDRALQLYLGLGFVKQKFLTRYYLDGQDAVRLKLWLRSPFEQPETTEAMRKAYGEYQVALQRMRGIEMQEGIHASGAAAAAQQGAAAAAAAADKPPALENPNMDSLPMD